ncbi:MAG: hypothetical protein KZQ62_19675 [Candidatus Thiodiazotropha sp. (ex Lucinoma aequizonata)]|nr:hypothetical protein [Candidatus Thiodiazotropha sp. (ex Lucinoma aequizonata)]
MLGERVDYSIRLERKVSRTTCIEVVTEGILTRRLQHDPELQGVGLIIFDGFHERNLHSARQKTHFFREPVLPHLVISSLIINTDAIFSCRRIKNDNNFYLWRLQVIPAPAALAACLVHASQAALFLRPRFRCSFSCSCCRSTAPRQCNV